MNREIFSLQQRYSKKITAHIEPFYSKILFDNKECVNTQKLSPFSLFTHYDFNADKLQSCFNTFFRDDLYGVYRSDDNLILSSGSLDPEEFPLCYALRYAIDFAMLKNWYGYSDSLGHLNTRNAIADLMNLRMPNATIHISNIALTNGVTSGLNTVLRTLKSIINFEFHILTHLPTYSPFYSACNSIAPVDSITLSEGHITAEAFIKAIKPETKVILLLGDLNPFGQMIPISTLNILINECKKKQIWIIFDEAGAVYPEYNFSELVYSPYFILLNSDSKKLGVPGLKTGYLVAPELFIEKFYIEASKSYGSPASIFYLLQEFHARFQQFSLMNLQDLDCSHLSLFNKDYQLTLHFLNQLYHDYLITCQKYQAMVLEKREWTIKKLKALPHHLLSQVFVPQTGVNLSIHIAQWNDSYRFFLSLLNEKNVSVFPGKCSGIDSGCWVRISYALPNEHLHTGINKLIEFITEHDIYSKCEKNPLYRHYLIELGGYCRYPWLNFWGHIDDVYQCMKRIHTLSEGKMSAEVNELFENLSYLHDCGKVISIRLAAVHRIWKNQKQKRTNWEQFSNMELLGLKERLLMGESFSHEELIELVPEEHNYTDLIDFEKEYSPSDDEIRNKIFELSTSNNTAVKLLKQPIPKLTKKSTIEEIALALLDISDKCSDYLSNVKISASDIFTALDKKEEYVNKRYGSDQAYNSNEIHPTFQLARHNLTVILSIN